MLNSGFQTRTRNKQSVYPESNKTTTGLEENIFLSRKSSSKALAHTDGKGNSNRLHQALF